MKKKLVIEIETTDKIGLLPDEGKSEDAYAQSELDEFRKEYSKDLANDLARVIKNYFEEGEFEERYLDNMEELSAEGCDNFKDYGVTIKVKEE